MKKSLIKIYEFFYEKKRILILRIAYRLRIMSSKKTIKYIINSNCSVARFGDGEIDQILKPKDIGFQKYSKKLSDKLEQVLRNNNANLLKCVPKYFNSLRGVNSAAKLFWLTWGKNGYHQKVVKYLRETCGNKYYFGDTQISRPYIDYRIKRKAKGQFDLLKRIWKDQDILIVEGDHSKLGVGNDLFDNAKSIKRIVVPATDAFDYYQEILVSIKQNCGKRLVLLAVGPTATVLASELCVSKIRAIDIGHVDIEYEWFLSGATEKIAIDGKFTNEAYSGISYGSICNDEVFQKQVLDRIGCQ